MAMPQPWIAQVVHVAEAPKTAPELRDLLLQLWAELDTIYGPNPGTEFSPEDLNEAVYFVAYAQDDQAVGCAALTPCPSADTMELKRMFVQPSARRRGVAQALLHASYTHAKATDIMRLRLETGVQQPAAIALYRREGFEPIPAWPAHDEDPQSLCFEKRLADGAN